MAENRPDHSFTCSKTFAANFPSKGCRFSCRAARGPVITLASLSYRKAPARSPLLMRSQRRRQHVGPVDVAAIVKCADQLTLAVSLHHKTTEVGNGLVDLILPFSSTIPPLPVSRIGRLQAAKINLAREKRAAEKMADAKGRNTSAIAATLRR